MEHRFDEIISEFSKLQRVRDKTSINNLLDNLNALYFKDCHDLNNDKAVLLIHQCCVLVTPSDTFLVAKCCHIILNLVSKFNVNISGKTLPLLIAWLCESLKLLSDIVLLDILQTLHVVINNHSSAIKEVYIDIIKTLGENLESNAMLLNPVEVKLWRVRCIQAVVLSGNLDIDSINQSADLILKILKYDVKLDDAISNQVTAACIETLQNICTTYPEWLSEHLGDIVGIIMAFIHFGLPNWKYKPPEKLYPVQISSDFVSTSIVPTGPSLNGNKRKLKRKVMKKLASKENDNKKDDVEIINDNSLFSLSIWSECQLPTSDSDFSDSEGGRKSKIRRAQSRVRLAVLNLTLQITKVLGFPKLYGYYTTLLGNNALQYSILHETFVRVKDLAIVTAIAFLSSGKFFFSNAQHSNVASYTPFSGVLADLLNSLHLNIIQALKKNNITVILIKLLHFSAALIEITPYLRLNPGLLTKLINTVHNCLANNVRYQTVAVIICFGAMVSHEQMTEEFYHILRSPPPIEEMDYKIPNKIVEVVDAVEKSWLIELCLDLLGDTKQYEQIRVAVWQVITRLARYNFKMLQPYLTSIFEYIIKSLDQYDNEPELIQAAKAFQLIAFPMAENKDLESKCVKMWIILLRGPLVPLLQSTTYLAGFACDSLSSIRTNIYTLLPEDLQILSITLLLGCSNHELSSVRSAAIRAFGMFIYFDNLMEDEHFFYDASDAVMKLIKDPISSVRCKAAWTLGNLIDCLYKSEQIELCDEALFEQLFEATLDALQDFESVKLNAIRGLGFLIKLLKPHHMLKAKYRLLLEKSTTYLTKLASSGKDMKMRWNASYAMSSFFENESVQGNYLSIWQEPVVTVLCKVIVNCMNFKVRVNAGVALSAASSRQQIGSQYLTAWSAILEGLNNAHNMPNFKEFKHQNNLFNQLCINLCNLTKLVEINDLVPLYDILVYNMDLAREHIERFRNSVLPEETNPLLAVEDRIKNFRKNSKLNSSQKAALSLLSNIFLNEII